ncbi:hypothetical protein BG261_06370 [Floricoccus tropicus]|uniref:Peptidase C51 domain-containing protein n=1 Tax=Floricoccus tropicus TaxID=1859473 RepID=A0A1E8GLX3_9LACT|nr:CHAP domain-containing protein [Floricoccus tropicus]OFI48518.1 hypothetical protein BG261_06370 [Floricoccus tropicus]
MATGLTIEQAKNLMKKYLDAPMPTYPGVYYGTYGGSPDSHSNCTLFSQWFLKNYTVDSINVAQPSGKGYKMVENFVNANQGKFTISNTPKAFSLFSITGPNSNYGTKKEGHTGIVLGIDGNNVITGEANYGFKYGGLDGAYPNIGTIVKIRSLSTFNSSTGVTFVDLNNYLVDELKNVNGLVQEDKGEEEDMTEFAFKYGTAMFYVHGTTMKVLTDPAQWSVLQAVYSQVAERKTGKAQKIKIFDWTDNKPTYEAYKKICDFKG